jgi:hypothetical protein
MAKFSYLTIERKYDIIDAETGHWLTHDMRGGVRWPPTGRKGQRRGHRRARIQRQARRRRHNY